MHNMTFMKLNDNLKLLFVPSQSALFVSRDRIELNLLATAMFMKYLNAS